MKKKLLLILFTFALSLGIFGASFSLDSYAAGISIPFSYINDDGRRFVESCNSVPDNCVFGAFYSGANIYYGCYDRSTGSFVSYTIYSEGYNADGSVWTRGGYPSSRFVKSQYYVSVSSYTNYGGVFNSKSELLSYTPSIYDDSIVIESYHAYWLGGLNSVTPVLSGSVSDNVDHIDVELYWDDVDSSPIATYTINPVLGYFFNLGASVPYIGMQGHKMIYKLVPYSVTGNYGNTYYSTVTSFNLNNTRYVDVPKASGNSTGRLDFNSYTQSVNSYSPISNINQSTVLDTYYNRTYNNDYSTSEEFYNEYDYSTVDKSYFSNNDLTFNTNIEINFPQLDGDWLKNLFQTFNFNLPTDLMNHWIPGVPNWIIDIIIAGIAIIVAAVIAKLLFTIL